MLEFETIQELKLNAEYVQEIMKVLEKDEVERHEKETKS